MKFNVYLLPEAENDLLEIYQYIFLNDSETNAELLYQKLLDKCMALKDTPSRGHIPHELNLLAIEDFLEIHYRPYRIIYRIINNEVFIHCILDGRREMQKLLQERLLKS